MILSEEQKLLVKEIVREAIAETIDKDREANKKRDAFIDHLIQKDEARQNMVRKVQGTVLGGLLLGGALWLVSKLSDLGFWLMHLWSKSG